MELSTEAKAMMLGAFLNPRTKLTFHNVENVPSEKARKGLTELVEAGLVSRTVDGIAETFMLTGRGMDFDKRTIAKNPFAWMAEHGSFPLSAPKKT